MSARKKIVIIISTIVTMCAVLFVAWNFIDKHEPAAMKRTDYHNTKGQPYSQPDEKPVQAMAGRLPAVTTNPAAAVAKTAVPGPPKLVPDKTLTASISAKNQGDGVKSFIDHDQKAAAAHDGDDAEGGGEENELSKSLLRSSLGPKSKAKINRNYLYTISAGRHIPCNRETAINSQLPGFVSCEIPQDVYNDDGSLKLLPAGSHVFGEIKSQVIIGNNRVPILWREIRTPDRPPITVSIASPGADELGRAGVTGAVNSHFWEALLATLTYTLIEAVPNAAIAEIQKNGSNTSINYNQFANPSQSLGSQVLRGYMNRPPTLEANPGEPLMIFIGSDIDMSPALSLTVRAAR